MRQLRHIVRHCGRCPKLTISQAEATLGVRFPPSYRLFLAQYGASFWKEKGLEIAGLFHQPYVSLPPYWENVVTWNLRERRGPHGLSPRYVAFRHDGMDATFLLDTEIEFNREIYAPAILNRACLKRVNFAIAPSAFRTNSSVIAANFNAFVTARLNNLLRFNSKSSGLAHSRLWHQALLRRYAGIEGGADADRWPEKLSGEVGP